MPNNPNKHHRRSIRLKGYDYSQGGLYFITICCQDRACRFGHIDNGEMVLNEFGHIAYNEWFNLPKRFANFELDVFQTMPNHMHGIIALNNAVGAGFTPAQNNDDIQNNTPAQNVAVAQNVSIDNTWAGASPAPTTTNATISDIVGAYKSLVANGCLNIWKLKWADTVGAGFTPAQIPTMGKLWQRNYYEHIIRNEQSYQTISNYIIDNPAKWNEDKFYTAQ